MASGSSPDVRGIRRGRPCQKEQAVIEKRRRMIAQWRFVEGLTEHQIHDRLEAQDDPLIKCSFITVVRDIAIVRKSFREYYGDKQSFDPVHEVAELIARYKYIAMKSMRMAADATRSDAALLFRTAMTAQKDLSELFFNCGFIDRKLGSMFIYGRQDDDKERSRIPSGTELQKLYDSIQVVDAELVSEAEAAWLHGDLAAAESPHEPKALNAGSDAE